MIFAETSSYFAFIAKALPKNIPEFFTVSFFFSDSELSATHSFACLFIVLGLKKSWQFTHGKYLSSGNFPFLTTLRLNFFALFFQCSLCNRLSLVNRLILYFFVPVPFSWCFERLIHPCVSSSYVLGFGIANLCRRNNNVIFVHPWGEVNLKVVENTPENKETNVKRNFPKKFF